MMVSVGTGMFDCSLGLFAATLSPTVGAVEVEGEVGTDSVVSAASLFFNSFAVKKL